MKCLRTDILHKMTRELTGAVALAFLFGCQPALSAGPGYPEYTLNLDKPIRVENQVLKAGSHSVLVFGPTWFRDSYFLHFLEDRALSASEIGEKTTAKIPL